MARVAAEHPHERVVVFPEELGAAPRLVGDGHDPVDVGVVALDVPEALPDELADARRAVDGRDHRHVVPGPHPPVGPLEPLEVAHLGGGVVVDRPDVDADLVLPLVVAHRQVVGVNVLTLRDRLRRETDDLAVPANRFPLGARPARDLVAGADVAQDLDPRPVVIEDRSRRDRRLGDDDVVFGVEDQRLRAEIVRRHDPWLLSVVHPPVLAHVARRSHLPGPYTTPRGPNRSVPLPPPLTLR